MTKVHDKVIGLLQDPLFLRKFHGWATLVWIMLAIPSVLFWSESVLWVIILSVWANVASHWASWQAARAEAKIDPEIDE